MQRPSAASLKYVCAAEGFRFFRALCLMPGKCMRHRWLARLLDVGIPTCMLALENFAACFPD